MHGQFGKWQGVVQNTGADVWGWIGLAALFSMGVFQLLKPEILWKIEHIFSVKGGEPTELYLALVRVGGVLLCLGTAVFAVVMLAT